jgi:hypothetical protein
MIAAKRTAAIAALVAASLSPAIAATHHKTNDRAYAHPPVITIYPARRYVRPYIDFSRYIDPATGMYCENTGWTQVCEPPRGGAYYSSWQGLNCTAMWPFPICTRF